MSEEEKLKRVLGLGYTTLFGVGLILGAGIYVLIGRAAGFSGDAVWLSVLFSTFIALTTGFSYAELSSMYPTAASTHTDIEKAFPRRSLLAFIAGWLIFFEGVAGAATASVGFARYFTQLFSMSEYWIPFIAIALVVILSFVNWWGIEESALMTVIFTFVEAGGLALVVFLGFMFPQRSPNYLGFNPTLDPIIGILIGAAVFYFAFTGFELQPTLSEETREPRKTIPRAIILALLVTSLLYLLVALAVVRLLPWDMLAESRAPLADAAATAWKPAYMVLMFIALFSTTNTVLGFLVSASRLAYGLASEGILSERLARVDKWKRTPYVSVLVSGLIAVLTILVTVYLPEITGLEVKFGEVEYKLIDMVGKTSSLAAILAFIMVNIAVIILRFTKPDYKRYFTIPVNIGRFPLLPAISVALIVFFLAVSFTDWIIWVSTAIVVLIGLIFYRKS